MDNINNSGKKQYIINIENSNCYNWFTDSMLLTVTGTFESCVYSQRGGAFRTCEGLGWRCMGGMLYSIDKAVISLLYYPFIHLRDREIALSDVPLQHSSRNQL